MKKARIEINVTGRSPYKTWTWVLKDERGRIEACGPWFYLSRGIATRAALRAQKLMAEAEVQSEK